jgi:hypothetical protein
MTCRALSPEMERLKTRPKSICVAGNYDRFLDHDPQHTLRATFLPSGRSPP